MSAAQREPAARQGHAYLGGLWDLTFSGAARRVTVELAFPIGEFDILRGAIGLPDALDEREASWSRGRLRPVMVLAARAPTHPETVEDVLGVSAATFLRNGLGDGSLRLTPELSRILSSLSQIVEDLPIAFPLRTPEA